MRYLGRTHRVSVAWLKEVCDAPHVHLAFVESAQQAADIFAKAFTDAARWTHACSSIQIGSPTVFLQAAIDFLPAPDGGTLASAENSVAAEKPIATSSGTGKKSQAEKKSQKSQQQQRQSAASNPRTTKCYTMLPIS